VNRRAALRLSGAALASSVVSACAQKRSAASLVLPQPPRRFAPVRASADRVIRQVAGLRPFRASGFLVRGEPLGAKLLVHNYGHGGGGITLSWGTAMLAVEETQRAKTNRFAVVGCGAVGLASARLLQRRGGEVTIYTINIPYCVDTGTPNNIVANFSPAVPSIGPGTIVMIKASNTNTGPTTININGLGPRPVFAIGGTPGMPFMPSDIITGDVLIVTYDGTQFWIVPNPALNHSTTINCANNADVDLAFKALARKRIQPAATVTIKLAAGIFNKITTFHSDADRIVLEGTMLAANPVVASFARTGSSSSARALDSANNIAMLRARYGTELKITNAELVAAHNGIRHTGPGYITIRNILVTGDNINANGLGAGITAQGARLQGCSFWGLGGHAIFTSNSGGILAYDTFVCSQAGGAGVWCTTGGSIILYDSGVFGGAADGVGCTTGASVWLYRNCYVQCNANMGGYANVGGCLWMGSYAVLTSNGAFDAYGYGNSTLLTSASATVGNPSPPVNAVGNYDSVNSAGG